MTKQYTRTATFTVDITPELLHRVNEILEYDDECISEDPDNLTPYETSVLTSVLDELWEDLWDEHVYDDKWTIERNTTTALS